MVCGDGGQTCCSCGCERNNSCGACKREVEELTNRNHELISLLATMKLERDSHKRRALAVATQAQALLAEAMPVPLVAQAEPFLSYDAPTFNGESKEEPKDPV